MKKQLLSYTPVTVIIHHGARPAFKRRGGALQITTVEIASLTEEIAMLIILLAGARKFYVPYEAYTAIREFVWAYLDRKAGGLNAAGLARFANDEIILQAAEEHKVAILAQQLCAMEENEEQEEEEDAQ